MQLRQISNLLTAAGAVIGGVAVLGYAFDLVPALPPAALKLVIYKLMFIGGLGLAVFGALVGKLARQKGGAPRVTEQDARDPGLLPEPGQQLDDVTANPAETPERIARRFKE